jgi:hypothetical protein
MFLTQISLSWCVRLYEGRIGDELFEEVKPPDLPKEVRIPESP